MIRIGQSVAEEVKLSDAIASSACFPGGFEPMIWPHDFVHDKSPGLLDQLKAGSPVTGLMDGGVYDNQGIQSILLYKKNDDVPYFDLIIISDVASPYMDPFKAFQEKPKEGLRNLSLNTVRKKLRSRNKTFNTILLSVAVLFACIPFVWRYSFTFFTGLSIGLAIVPLAFMVLKWKAVSYVKTGVSYMRDALARLIPEFYQSKLAGLKIEELSVHRIEPLLFDRLNSLITLLMDVFLKVVRRLNYGDLYNDDKFSYRRMSNLIKELTEVDFNKRRNQARPETNNSAGYKANSKLKSDYDIVVGPKIKSVVEEASGFGTTLWFTEDNQLDNMLSKLLATGQFTMCYNILDYLEQIIFVEDNGFSDLDLQTQSALKKIYDECVQDWNHFKEDPMFLVNEMEK